MNVGTRKTLASFALMLIARTAGTEGSGAPPWQESSTARLEALALLQTLNAELLSHDSATLTLDRWCSAHRLASPAHIVAERVDGAYHAPTDEQRQLLGVNATEPVRYRRVRLICGDRVLSEADNWYVPARLTPEMNRVLETTDTAFGRAVQTLKFRRRTLSAKLPWSPLPHDWEMGAPAARAARSDTRHPPRGAEAPCGANPAGRHAIQRGGRDLHRRGACLPRSRNGPSHVPR
jgi:chorismate-pyruvate lyase